MALSRQASPHDQPPGIARAAGDPAANGTSSRLRGRLKSTVRPVVASMLASVTLSGRVPTRSGPASPPSRSTV